MVIALNLQYIYQLSIDLHTSQITTAYRTSASTLGRELIEHPFYTVDL